MKRITLIILAVATIIASSVSCQKANDIDNNSLSAVAISIIPDFSDGSVYSCSDEGSFFLRVSVKPEKYIEKLSDNDAIICKADFRSVITKANVENPDFTVVGEITSSFVEEGYMTTYFELAEDEVAKIQKSNYVVSLSIEDKDNTHVASTSYVPMDNPRGGWGGDVPGDDVIDLSLTETANCYIVSQGGAYKFKTVKGNTNETVGDVKGVKVLWETFGTATAPNVGDLIKADVSYADGYITFSTNDTYHKGNAVIAAYSDAGCAEGNVLWSWHIWLTDQPIEQEYTFDKGKKDVEKITIMDRNLGATSGIPGDVEFLGLLYQWGRKDPFLGSSDIYPSSPAPIAQSTIEWPSQEITDETKGTVDYVTKHPTTFLVSPEKPFDWSIPQNDNLWSSSKTQYDPCPPGWRVQDVSFWEYFIPGNGGTSIPALFNENSRTYQPYIVHQISNKDRYYPASGYYSQSGMSGVGEEGYYWTCCDKTKNSIHFKNGYNTGVRIAWITSFIRIYGCSVRCQKIE